MTNSASDSDPSDRGCGVLIGIMLFVAILLCSPTVTTATHEPIVYGTDSGLNVTDASGGSLPNGTPFSTDETVDLPGITISADGGAAITIDQRTGTTTDLSGIDIRHSITVDPDDKGAVVLLAGLDTLTVSAVDYGSSNTDITYTASEQAGLRLTDTGLSSGTTIEAIDVATGTQLAQSTTAANGSVAFTTLPTGRYDVTLRNADSGDDSVAGAASSSSGSGPQPTDEEAYVDAFATIVAESQFVTAGTTVWFDATRSRPSGPTLQYAWDFDGDGTTDATGPRVSRTFVEPGRQTVTLTVQSARTLTDGTDSVIVRVRNETPSRSQQSATPTGTESDVTSSAWLVPSVRNLNFGGSTDPSRLAVRLRNPLASTTDIRIDAIEIVGSDSDQFSVVDGGRETYTLAPGQSQRIEIRETADSRAPRHAQLRVHSDADNSQLDIWLSTTSLIILIEEQAAPVATDTTVSVEAHNVDRNSHLSVNVSKPISRTTAANIETLEMAVTPAGAFDMGLTHASDPVTVDADPYKPADRTVLQYIRLRHSIPDDAFDDTAIVYRVDKRTLPQETTPVEIVFRRYSDGEWNELPSSLQRETATHYVFRVETDGFSQFLVTGPTAVDPSPSTGDIDYLLAGVLVVGMIGGGVLLLKTRRRNASTEDVLE